MGRTATHQVWAISFITLPQLSPEVPFPQRQEDQGRGANTQPVKSHAPPVCPDSRLVQGYSRDDKHPVPEVEETYSKSSDI